MRLQSNFGMFVALAAVLGGGCLAPWSRPGQKGKPLMRGAAVAPALSDRQMAALNRLRDRTNLLYGYRNTTARVNLGPCGRFAKAFRGQWNARFTAQANIAFVMSADGKECYHVLVRLPDGNYFDGGNGVISGETLLRQYDAGTRLEEMKEFDLQRLDKWSYGLGRSYELCPNYSDEATAKLIEECLAAVSKDKQPGNRHIEGGGPIPPGPARGF